ncbi:MAG: right-handed parallel beta-helix repeat-containing protein [Paludibacteraceae bacterium]
MKIKLLVLLAAIATFNFSQAQTSTTENFESGLPTSAVSSETPVTLSSGTWKINGAYGKSDNGSVRLAMNTNGYAVTPTIDKPTSVSFNHRGSGSGKIVTIQKSTDSGTTWTTCGTATVNSSSTYGSSSISIGEQGTKGVLIKFICGSATIYIDNVIISCSSMGDEPTTQSAITATEVTATTIKINFVKGDGAGRLLVYSKNSDANWTPTDGTAYFNLPKSLDTNIEGIYSGNDDFVTVNGLESGATYHFSVFEYSGSNDAINYLISPVGKLTQKTIEAPSITTNPVSITMGAIKVGSSSKRSFTVFGKYLSPESDVITLTSSPDFLISTDAVAGFTTSVNLNYSASTLSPTTIYVQFLPTELKPYSHTLSISGGNAEGQILLNGTGSDTDNKVYFISPSGNDGGEGTFESPWYNLQKAVDACIAGDTVFVRGGTYYPNMMKDGTKTTIRLTVSGSANKKITIKNYQDELPILNFKDQPKKVSVRGIQLNGNYWHIKGLHITQAGDNGIKLEGNHNVIEKCTFSYNDDTGLQLGFGHSFSDTHPGISSNDGSYCAYNDVIDCDAYLNCDADNFGSDADGFACKMHNGKGNRFIRCRAWDNADDGWDLFETDYPVEIIECWAWGSGRAENFTWVQASGSFQGNGNGIKLGGNGTGGSSKGKHEVWNSVAFNCNKTGSVKGFDQNSHSDGEKLVNCLAFGCGYDFMFETNGPSCEFYNNVCFGNIEIASGNTNSNNAMLSSSNKAWTNVIRGFSAADYVSLSEDDAKAPRGADGKMPTRFARLRTGSVLIDKGLPYNIPYAAEFPYLQQAMYGGGRDLGPYELEEGELSGIQIIMNHEIKLDLNVLPNPCKTETIVKFSSELAGNATIKITDMSGRIIEEFYRSNVDTNIDYYIPVSVKRLQNGVYFCILNIGNQTKTAKLIVMGH